jgi:hypothetical protein
MKSYLSLFLVVFVLIGFSCVIHIDPPVDNEEYPSDGPLVEEYPQAYNSDFDARINAAKSIMNFSSRDKALSSIAQDAAHELDIHHTIQALSMITNFSIRDNTADKCVNPFINENMIEEAQKIAKNITNFSTRDRVLARIAQGPENNY